MHLNNDNSYSSIDQKEFDANTETLQVKQSLQETLKPDEHVRTRLKLVMWPISPATSDSSKQNVKTHIVISF